MKKLTEYLPLMGLLFLASALIYLTFYLESEECKDQAFVLGLESRWSATGGCMLEYQNGKWIQFNRLNTVDVLIKN